MQVLAGYGLVSLPPEPVWWKVKPCETSFTEGDCKRDLPRGLGHLLAGSNQFCTSQTPSWSRNAIRLGMVSAAIHQSACQLSDLRDLSKCPRLYAFSPQSLLRALLHAWWRSSELAGAEEWSLADSAGTRTRGMGQRSSSGLFIPTALINTFACSRLNSYHLLMLRGW